MIVIDKSLPVQKIILTLTELTAVADAAYVVKLKNDATRFEYSFTLSVNYSPAPERYDLYQIATAVFDGMPIGYYTFSILIDSETPGNSIEDGKLLIKDLTVTEYVSPSNPDKNEYIIY